LVKIRINVNLQIRSNVKAAPSIAPEMHCITLD